MKEIGINELPLYSPWPARLLCGKWIKPSRTSEKVLAEYDKDKYAKLLTYWLGHEITARELARYGMVGQYPFSIKSKLYLEDWNGIMDIADKVLIDAFKPYISLSDTIIELGAGWGYNLFTLHNIWPDKKYIGGDISLNAVKLAGKMAIDYPNCVFETFNFNDDNWAILDNIEGKTIIFTRHAIEQLPTAKWGISQLSRYRDKVAVVIHLEPIYELIPEVNLLDLLRKSYTQANDYNTDLLTAVKESQANILATDYDLIGSNPLNPTSLLVWKF